MTRAPIKFSAIREAFDFANFGGPEIAQAFVDLETGETYWVSDYIDPDFEEPLPDDIESDKYIELPYKNALNLGRRLALEFAREELPDFYDKVREIFSSRGAYARFKDLLDYQDKLQDWYAYEEAATDRALREWCELNDIVLQH